MMLIHEINAWASFVLAVALNLLLVYLIIRFTVKEMRGYSSVLLSTCLLDMLMAISILLQEPVLGSAAGFQYIAINSQLGRRIAKWVDMGQYWPCLFAGYFMLLEPTMLATQFIFRYCTLCRGLTLNMKHFFSLNFVLSTWVIGLYIGFYYISSPLENGVCRSPSHLNTTNLMRTLSAFLGESEVMLCACVESKEPMYFVMLGYLIFFSVLVYAIIIYCARQIHTFSKQFAFDDQTSRYINRQILKTLVVQAIIPVVSFVPINMSPPLSYCDENIARYLTSWMMIPIPWISVLNPIVTIFIVKSYYRNLMRICKRQFYSCQERFTLGSIKPANKTNGAVSGVGTTTSAIL